MKFINKQINQNISQKLINEYAQEFNLSKEIVKLIFSRGITNKQEFINYINPSISQYYNPYQLFNMDKAVEKIKEHINKQSKIVIVGDYDSDGICATAILYKYFESINYPINYFLPNRFTDGYGLTLETVDKINKLFSPNLIITVDCGISCFEEVDYAKSIGIEMVITDHHEIPSTLPNCIFVDPKYTKQQYPFKELCGAGVAFKLVQALDGLAKAVQYDSIAMIATVADIVPLLNENRAIVSNGLKHSSTNLPLGIKMLLQQMKITEINSTDISFKVAPKLNTAGRLGDASLAFKLFIETDKKILSKIIEELDSKNTERISYCNNIAEECLKQAENINISEAKALILSNDNWNHGVLGIVCAKLVEKFNKPVCLLTKVDNVYKGSIRSIDGINIYEVMTRLSHLLLKFGGHAGAGGLTIEPQNLNEFIVEMNRDIKNHYSEEAFEQTKYYDFDLNKISVDIDFMNQLSILEPYGYKNEKPLFKANCNNVLVNYMKNHENHIKLQLNGLEVIGFNYSNYYLTLNTNSNKEFLLDLNIDSYKNKQTIKGFIKAIEIGKLNTSVKSEIELANYLNQLSLIQNKSTIPHISLNENKLYETAKTMLNQSSYGTILIASTFATYQKAIQMFGNVIYNYECFNLMNQTGLNTLFFSPIITEKINNYSHVFYLDNILCEGVKNTVLATNIYINSNQTVNYAMFNLSIDRGVFGNYHNSIKNMIQRKIIAFGEYDYFNKLKKLNPQLKNASFLQFKFVTMVLQELNILSIINNSQQYEIKVNENINSKLSNSAIYNYISLLSKLTN